MSTRTTSNHSPVAAILIATAIGAFLAIALVLVVAPDGSEPTITGSTMVGFALGWALMAWLTTRFSAQPQAWMKVPAVLLGAVGLGLVVTQPNPTLMDLASWIWPPTILALGVWMVGQVRAKLLGRGRLPVYVLIAVQLLFAAGGGLTAIGSSVIPTASAGSGQLVDVGGRRLFIECIGSGTPVVMLQAGLGESSSSWARVAPVIAAHTTVCAYDRAGHGRSDEAPTSQDGDALATDLHILLDRAGVVGPYVLVGHSSGGVYVRVFAARYPNEVAGMVLLDAQPADAFTSLPDYASTYRAFQIAYPLAPSLARIGLLGLLLGLPAEESTVSAARAARDEVRALPAALDQGLSLTTIGNRPLAVITAGTGQQGGWVAAQDRLVGLSTSAVHRTVAGATHTSLITGADAGVSSQAVLDVVTSIRTGAPMR